MKTYVGCVVFGSCLLFACGSPKSTPVADMVMSDDAAAPDLAQAPPPPPDLAQHPIEASVSCGGPADCHGGTPVCCTTLTLAGGSLPACNTSAIDVSCKAEAQCMTQLSLSCTGAEVLRLCTANSDCTEPSYNKCCSFPVGGGMHICSTDAIAHLVGGSCL